MAFLNRNQVKLIVTKALHKIADFSGEIEHHEFRYFHQFHKEQFLTNLKIFLNESPYYDRSGNTDFDRFYDVPLSMSILNRWTTIADCIDFIHDYHVVKKRNPNRLSL